MRASIRTCAVFVIRFYRRYLSPIKGFHCAYASYGYGDSCSTYGLRVYGRHSPTIATLLMNRQFQRCAIAAGTRAKQKGEINPCACIAAMGEQRSFDRFLERSGYYNKDNPKPTSCFDVVIGAFVALLALSMFLSFQSGKGSNSSSRGESQPNVNVEAPPQVSVPPAVVAPSPGESSIATRSVNPAPSLQGRPDSTTINEGDRRGSIDVVPDNIAVTGSGTLLDRPKTELPFACRPSDAPVREMRRVGVESLDGSVTVSLSEGYEIASIEVRGVRSNALARAVERVFADALSAPSCTNRLSGFSREVTIPFVFRLD